MKQIIKLTESDSTMIVNKVIREQKHSKEDVLRKYISTNGLDFVIDMIGVDNVVKIFGGIKNYLIETGKEPFTITNDGMTMYVDPLVASQLNLVSVGGDFRLGDYRWTSGGANYKFTAYLYPLTNNGKVVKWKVIGSSGDYGFGYSWITKKNTIGKRGRTQIFKQIIDKYKLNNIK